MTADVIKFPKQKAKPAPTAFDLRVAHAHAVGIGEALLEMAAEAKAARERGDLSPAMQQIAALAALSGDDD